MAPIARGTAFLLLTASVVAIVAATTMPWSAYYVGHSHWPNVEWIPFSRRVRPLDFLLNVLLFVPFGYSASLALNALRGRDASPRRPPEPWRRWRRPHTFPILIAALLLSLAVELFQVYCHGRLPTTTDVLANTMGAWLGSIIGDGRFGEPALPVGGVGPVVRGRARSPTCPP